MAIDPGTMQQMLMQRLQQAVSGGSAGGGQGAGPAMQSQIAPMNAAAMLSQKLMLMKALQGQRNTQQANAMLPQTNRMMQQDPTLQALQQSPQLPPVQFPAGGPNG